MYKNKIGSWIFKQTTNAEQRKVLRWSGKADVASGKFHTKKKSMNPKKYRFHSHFKIEHIIKKKKKSKKSTQNLCFTAPDALITDNYAKCA